MDQQAVSLQADVWLQGEWKGEALSCRLPFRDASSACLAPITSKTAQGKVFCSAASPGTRWGALLGLRDEPQVMWGLLGALPSSSVMLAALGLFWPFPGPQVSAITTSLLFALQLLRRTSSISQEQGGWMPCLERHHWAIRPPKAFPNRNSQQFPAPGESPFPA